VAPHGFGCVLDGGKNARMSAAPADIALERLHDVGGIGMRILLQQSDAAHDETRGAVGALKSVVVDEGLLDGMKLAVLFEALDGKDGFAGSVSNGELAGTAGSAVDEDGARAALAFAAAVLGAGEAKLFAEDV